MASLTFGFVGCNKDPEEELLDLYSDAGNSFLDIENEGYKVSLNAIPAPQELTGTWRIYNGENGKFENVNKANSIFYGEPGEIYLLGWEISDGDRYEASTINVSFKQLNPELAMTVNDTIKGNISLYLNSIAPKFGAEGHWEIVNGSGGQLINETSHEAQFVGLEETSYKLRWNLTYGSKIEGEEIEFTTDILKAYAGEDQLDIITDKSANKFMNLNAFLPAAATAEWEIISGDTVEVLDTEDPSSVLKGIADKEYKLLWKVTLGEHKANDTLKIRFRGKWGMFTDERDGKSYRYAVINGVQWMADNFDYNAPFTQYGRSWYYGQSSRAHIEEGFPVETPEDRKRYGRLYNQFAAYEAAPPGWRLPTREDIDNLITSLGGIQYAFDKMAPGGETGLELSFAGICNYSNESPLSRDWYSFQDIAGAYWTDYHNNVDYSGIIHAFYIDSKSSGEARLSSYYAGASVRYIRDDN